MKRNLILLPLALLLLTACSTSGSDSGGSSAAETEPVSAGFAGKWVLSEADGRTEFVFEGLLDQPEIPYCDLIQLELRENGEAYFIYPLYGYDDTMHWSSFADAMRRNGLDPEKPESWGDALNAEETEKAKDYLAQNAVSVFRSETNWITEGSIYVISPGEPDVLSTVAGSETLKFTRAAEFPDVPEELPDLYRVMQGMQGAWGCERDPQLAVTVSGCTVEVYRGSPEPAETLQLRRQPDNTFLLESNGSAAGTLAFRGSSLIRRDADGNEWNCGMISDEELEEIRYSNQSEQSTDAE